MKLIKIISKRIKTIKVGAVVKTLFRLAIRAKHLIRPELNYKKYYLKATPWLTPERKAPLLISSFKFKFSLIPLIVCLLVIFSFVALITRINSRKTPKVQAFNPQLSPAPVGSNYLYQNITNGYKVYLGDRLQEAKPRVKFEEENSSAEFSLAQVPSQEAQLQNQDNKAVIYKNVWPGIDINYSLTEKGVKEEIVISSRDSLSQLAKGQLEFNLNLKNAIPRKSLEGKTSGYFVEPNEGQYVFHIPQPFMTDATGNRSEAVGLKIEQHSVLDNAGGQSTYTVTLIPDSRWLDSAFYPVTIDPSVVHDESSEFSGTKNRIEDAGSGTTPKLRTPYHELPADIHTVGLWHMNESSWNNNCSTSTVTDSSGNAYHGKSCPASTGPTTTSSSKLGAYAGSLDGSNDYLTMGDVLDFERTDPFTIEAWIKHDTSVSTYRMIVAKVGGSTTYRGYEFYTTSGYGYLEFDYVSDFGATNLLDVRGTTPVNDNTWHHVAVTYDGSSQAEGVRMYIDGKPEITTVVYNYLSATTVNTASLNIGVRNDNSDSNNYLFKGTIDEVRISDVARTAEEIKQDAQRFPYGVYTSDTIDLTGGTSTVASLDSLEWTDNVSTPGATLDGWPNFKPVIIDNTQNANTLTNYQTKVKVDYDSNMQADFDDLRFTSHTQAVGAYGSEATFNSASTEYIPVAKLDSTHFVVGYHDIGGDSYGHAKIGTVSGTTISYGDEYTFNSAGTGYISVAALDSTHFVVGYWDSGGDTYGHAKIGTISGSTISYGSEYTFNSADSRYISVAALDSTHFVVGYRDNGEGSYGKVKIGTVSGSTITYGSEATFNSATTSYLSVAALDSTHFVVGYEDYGGDKYGHAKIGTVSGTTISYGSEYTFNSATTEHLSVAALDSTHFVVGYWNWGGDYYGYAKIGTVSGSTITYGSAYLFNSATTYYISVDALDSTHFVVGYQDFAGDSYGHAKIGTVSGSTISYGGEYTFNSAATKYISVTHLDSTHFVVGYMDDGGDDYGHAKFGTVVNTNLDYWIETKTDGVEATVWVEVDTIPANSLTMIWMWYGNSGASAASNGDNTFSWFDDFPGSSLDATKWPNTSGSPVVSSGSVELDTASGTETIRNNTTFSRPNIMEFRSRQSHVQNYHRAGFSNSSAGTVFYADDSAHYFGNYTSGVNHGVRTYNEGSAQLTDSLGTEDTDWHDYKIIWTASNVSFYIDDTTLLRTHSSIVPDEACYVRLEAQYIAAYGIFYVDWVFVRQHTSPEPITGVGADVEFQTRTSSDGSSWEAWKPTTAETAITSMDSDATNWTASTENLPALNYGSEATFNSASSTFVSAASLDSTHFAVGYRDTGGDTQGHAKVGTISGTTITYGNEYTFNAANTEYISVAALDSTHFVVGYKDTGGDTYGHAKIGTVSGSTITYGDEYTFNSAATDYISVAALDSTHFAVAYRDAGGDVYGHAKIGTVSSTISYGSEATFNANDTYYISTTVLDSTHFVVGFQLDGSNYGQARVGAVSDSTITFGDVSTFNATSTFEISVDALDSTHFVVGYGYSITYGRAKIGTVSGSTISYGSESTFLTDSALDSNGLSVAALDSTHFVVGYKNLYGTSYGRTKVGTVSGSTISYGSDSAFNTASSLNLSVTALDADYFVVGYRDAGGDTYGHAKVGKLITQNLSIDNESTIKMEGSGSMIATVGAQLVDSYTRALWHLEETSGSGAYLQDESANNNDGTPIGTSAVDGFWGKARNYNGSSDCVSVSNESNFDFERTNSFSIEAWIKWDGSGQDTIFSKLDSSSPYSGYEFHIRTDSKLGAHLVNTWGSNAINVYGSTALESNQWYHVAMTYDGSSNYRGVRFYIDGKEEARTYDQNTLSASMLNNITPYIGSRNNSSSFFDGTIDELRISNVVRTPEEIAEAYRAGRDHRLQRTISSTDLSGKTKVPFYFAADKQGTIAETYVGESDQAIYRTDSNTVGLWHLEEPAARAGGLWRTYGSATWANAQIACQSAGGDLVTINDATENTIVFNLCGDTNNCWIGFNDQTTEGTFVWAGGSGSGYLNWNTGEPNDYGGAEDCGHIAASTGGLWNDNSCTGVSYYGICEYKAIKDESGNNYHALPNGTPTQGKIGRGRYFNGTTSSDNIEHSVSNFQSSDSAGTVEAWIYPRSFSYYRYVFASADDATNTLYMLGFALYQTTGKPYVYQRNNDTQDTVTSDTAVNLNQWNHLAWVSTGTEYKIYINGESQSLTVDSGSNSGDWFADVPSYRDNITIGALRTNGTTSNPFYGIIDEVRVSNTARSADDIRLAYQYGIRTHQITSDYATTAGSDGPTSTSDLQFTPDTTTGLYKGDTVIVRENYNGTNYIMQGEVSSISSGLVTVASWSGTAPSGGYSTNADVFKWQREYWDLNDISPGDRNATVRLGLRVLDASEGFTMYLDDFRNNTNYLTDNLGSTITSTANRYIQYRAILSTNNTEVTPELTSVTLDYNRAPTAPTSLLTEGLTNPIDVTDLTPEFSAVYNDDDTWDIANKYRIQVDDDSAFGSTIWDSGAAGTAMNNCVQGDRCQDISYAGSAPTPDTKYYWRIKYWDDQAGEGDWSTETAYFTVALAPPANCVIEDGNQPDELTVRWDDMSSNETGFRVEKNIDAAGFNYLTDKAADSTSHLDNTTSANHTYQYRVRAEAGSTYSLWCTTLTVDLSTAEGANEGFRFEGVKMEGLKIE